MRSRLNGLTARRFYALIWKDFVVHKRHYVWTLLEITIPVLVCAMAILSNSHQGKPRLENERTFDPDDYERIYGDLSPQRHRLLVAPNTSFTRALVDQIDDGAVSIELCNSERDLVELIKREIPVSLDQVKRLLPDDNANVTIGGVVIQSDVDLINQQQQQQRVQLAGNLTTTQVNEKKQTTATTNTKDSYYYEVISKIDGQRMKIPVNFHMSIKAKDFRLGPEPFPKKYSLGPFLHSDHYTSTFFMASQIMLSRAYINLLATYLNSSSSSSSTTSSSSRSGRSAATSSSFIRGSEPIVIPTNDDIIGQRMPYPKYVAHKRLKETTLGTFVAGSQKQKPFVLTMDYCITVGFLVTAIFLAKRIVDEKKSKVRDMLRLVGISDWTYYGSHMCNTMIVMIIQCALITLLFTGHADAPAQNIDSTLLFVILLLYCLSSIMFVLALSTIFNSSTKAIIFTSLLWLGLPEIIDRVFKMNSGVIESNGFLAADEHVHLMFSLLPNFGLRLMNRLLTECDIYGEFYEKKQLYGEYRAIWPNLTSVLPLYKSITIAHIMFAMFLSIPIYAALIYLINLSSSGGPGGLAKLGETEASESKSSSPGVALFALLNWLVNFILGLVVAPFKLVYHLLIGASAGGRSGNSAELPGELSASNWSAVNLNQSTPDVIFFDNNGKQTGATGGHINRAAGLDSANSSDWNLPVSADKNNKKLLKGNKLVNMELSSYPVAADAAGKPLNDQQAFINSSCPSIVSQLEAAAATQQQQEQSMNDRKYFETAPKMLTTGVSIRNLCKTYYTSSSNLRRIDAVRNVSLDLFYSQILVLLGHNGAGKTTLIDIISGHNQKSSGSIHIDGYNIDTHPSEARRRVGFCPQFDVLFERLTVEEHLFFYGIVKGARSELKQEIEELLKQSGLDKHRRKLSKALSGGYKRKLSLAIAMIAKSKVLILDEPTSGMDPESRRKVWDFLQLIRHDRLILMTTHHMEEADALGDRIAVMSGGQVKCAGSALFLKKVFNAGYHLRISKSATWNQIAFEELIGVKYKLQEKLENVTPHELMYKFDADETGQVLPALFDELEKEKDRVGIFGFGITVSTMDDVFMRIGIHFKDVEAQEMQSRFQMANGLAGSAPEAGQQQQQQQLSAIKMNGAKGMSPMAGCRKERLEGGKLFKQHLRALLAKRYHHARKNWFQLLWIWAISLACVISVVVLIDLVIFKEELTPEWSREMSLEGAGYGSQTSGVYQFAAPGSTGGLDELEVLRDQAFGFTGSSTTSSPGSSPPPVSTSSTTSSAPATSTTTISSSSSSPETTSSSAELAGSGTTASSTMASATEAATNEPSTDTSTSRSELLALPDSATEPPLPTTTTSAAETTTTGSRRRRRRRQVNNLQQTPDGAAANDSSLFLNRYWLNEAKRSGMKELLTYTDINTQMIDLITRQFADFREHYVIGGEKVGKKYIAWYSGEATHSFPISMNIMLNSILKQFTDLIQDNGHPLKGSRISLRHDALAQINTLIAFLPHLGRLINLVFLPFSLAFITSYFVIFPTHERVTKSKHLQLMTGVPARTFWLSHFLFDLFLYATYTISVLAIYFVWDRVINDRRIYFANFHHSVALVALVTLFIFGALPLAYIFSFIAKKPTSAFSSFCVLTILTGTATLTLVSLYELKYEQTASSTFKTAFMIFLWSARLIPSVSLLVGLQKLFALNTTRSICINISPEVLELLCRYINSPLVDDELRVLRPERCCKQVCQDECFDQWPFFWSSWFGINIELAMLVFDAVLLWSILVIIESRSVRRKLWQAVYSLAPLSAASKCLSKARSYCWQVPQFVYDKELHQEQCRIEQIVDTRQTDNYAIVVKDLTKVYPSNQFKAVDQLSFVVDKREFFGLLGVNGAGKSTTFKMLTGELGASSGNSWIGEQDLTNQRRQYLKQIGYCPQQDALIDNMTGVEMLTLFARLRGIPEHYISDAVEDTLDKLGLKRIGRIDCQNYSGGNKRRLSVGMALIGAPELVFLDEPTSGVDPRSRRRLWSTLIEFQQQTKSAIVMTSHSMNECECLCDRVAIMVGGQFKVLGSIQYLRTKLSQGFSLVLKLKPDNLKQVQDLTKSSELIHDYMKRTFSSSEIKLKDLHQTIIQYHIEPSKELTWSKMLLALEKAKQDLELEDYQITSDASLESIFLSLAKQ